MKLKLKIRKNNSIEKYMIICSFIVALFFISIGYSYIATNLKIFGEVSFSEEIKQSKNEKSVNVLGQTMTAYIDNTASEYVLDKKGINFSIPSSDTNGKGLYLRAGTENDEYPIYYYRGEVDNNHVLFGGFCWKIVRSTEQGGVKLIYNGIQKKIPITQILEQSEYAIITNDETSSYTFNGTTKKWTSNMHDHNNSASIVFTVSKAGEYLFDYTISSEENFDKAYIYINGVQKSEFISGSFSSQIELGSLKTSDVIEVRYSKDESGSRDSDNIEFSILKIIGIAENTCDNIEDASQLNETERFSIYPDSIADIGYMYGTRYAYTSWDDEAFIYGSDVTFNDGVYILKDIEPNADTAANVKTKHYTCKLTTNDTCNRLFYVYRAVNNRAYAIMLYSGNKIDNVISNSFKNTNSSNIKQAIDNWFVSNLLNQEEKLEDAVWCNNRSIVSGGYLRDGDNSEETFFGGYRRVNQKIQPAVKDIDACPDKNDRFTKNDKNIGNGALNYSVGLLTSDELVLAGNVINDFSNTSYLSSGRTYWILSPYSAASNGYSSTIFSVGSTGNLINALLDFPRGVRPSIVLKHDMVATGGDGTATNPYVVE